MKFFYKISFIALFTLTLLSTVKGNFVVLGDGGTKALKCYPNPANNNVYFEFNKIQDKNTRLFIFNFVGKQIIELKVENSKVNLSLETFYRGLYLYKLVDRTGKVLDSGKFQVIK